MIKQSQEQLISEPEQRAMHHLQASWGISRRAAFVALDGPARARAQRRAADAHALAGREQLRPDEPHPLVPAEAASGADLHGVVSGT